MEEPLKLPSTTYWMGGGCLTTSYLAPTHTRPASLPRKKEAVVMALTRFLLQYSSCSAALQPHAAPACSPLLG